MHEVDQTTEQMVRSVLAYAENRLRMNPVPLDKGTLSAEELCEGLGGLIRDDPRPPDHVLGVYTSVIAPSVISADSPAGARPAAVVLAGGLRPRGPPRRHRDRRRAGRQTAELITQAPQLELIREPDLGVVLFRRIGWAPADYDAWSQRLHQDQVAFIPPTKWEDETVGRFAFLHPDTGIELVREVLARTA
jgi:hypothetical protein